MIFEIHNNNININLTDNYIVINPAFLQTNNLTGTVQIKIKEIHDKEIKILVKDIDNPNLSIDIKECSFSACFVENSIFKSFDFLNVEISNHTENKFKPFHVYFDNSKLDSILAMFSIFYTGFLIRNNSEVKSMRISDSTIENSLTFINSKGETLEVESSKLEYLEIDRMDYPKVGSTTEIDNINIFRTDVIFGLRIWESKFKTLSFYKMTVSGEKNPFEHRKNISISTPKDYKDIEKIKIEESNIEKDIIINVNNVKNLDVYNNSFRNFKVIFWNINEFSFETNIVAKSFFLGYQNNHKTIHKFNLSNNTFENDFYLSEIVFYNEFFIKSSSFNKFPSFIESCYFEQNCKSDFEFSNFSNLIFQDINFEFISFKNFDVTNATFRNCEWKIEKYFFYKKYLIQDESDVQELTIEDLIQIKKVYSNLKSNFQDKNDFINSSRFYISEQDIKMKITLQNKSFLEFLILSLHKGLSVYGESLTKVIFVLVLSILIFSNIYLFQGFKSGNTVINYSLEFDACNLGQTFKDFLKALILSVKNVVPFPLNNKFYIYTNENFTITQTFELIQKIFNFIVLASFTETFVKYLKK